MRVRRVGAAALDLGPLRVGWDSVIRRARNEHIVRSFIEAYLGGDIATARAYVCDDVKFRGTDPSGEPVQLVGLDALVEWGRRRRAAVKGAISWRVVDLLSSDGRVATLFEEHWGAPESVVHPYVALYHVRHGRIESLRVDPR